MNRLKKLTGVFFVTAICTAICIALVLPGTASAVGRTDFKITFNNITSDLKIMSTTVLPGQALDVLTDGAAFARSGQLAQLGNGWRWTAPEEPGLTVLTFNKGRESIRLNVFVLSEWRNGQEKDFHGYTVGEYVKHTNRGPAYEAPRGFIEARPELLDVHVSPNFKLGHFMCKQQPGHDRAPVLIRSETLIKLELLVEKLAEMGWPQDSVKVMSGFRTPHYNHAIGNRTSMSRHLYGGAADIYVDGDGDGVMDDLNKDGKVNKQDAYFLAELVEELSVAHDARWTPGGIAVYSANAAHGPFIHIDSRGYNVQW